MEPPKDGKEQGSSGVVAKLRSRLKDILKPTPRTPEEVEKRRMRRAKLVRALTAMSSPSGFGIGMGVEGRRGYRGGDDWLMDLKTIQLFSTPRGLEWGIREGETMDLFGIKHYPKNDMELIWKSEFGRMRGIKTGMRDLDFDELFGGRLVL